MFNKLKKDKHREAFVQMLRGLQSRLGKYQHWGVRYMRKCLQNMVKPAAAVKDAV